MDMTNISVILDDDFFEAYWTTRRDQTDGRPRLAHTVYWTAVEKMLTTGEPGFSVDTGENAGEHLRNACTEVTSARRQRHLQPRLDQPGPRRLGRGVRRLVSWAPPSCSAARCTQGALRGGRRHPDEEPPPRLGLMGIYEWLVKRGYAYEPNDELATSGWRSTPRASALVADVLRRLPRRSPPGQDPRHRPDRHHRHPRRDHDRHRAPVRSRLQARYLKGTKWHFQYVVDATAQRLVDQGVDPDKLETAYDLAKDPERGWPSRHGCSSTSTTASPAR
jgi:ribonucleoside-diphosphate reductase alpha chain